MATRQRQIVTLYVNEDPSTLDLAKAALERNDERFNVRTATGTDEAIETVDDLLPDCIVSSHDTPGHDGIELLRTVRDEFPALPFVLFTGEGSEDVASEAVSAGVTDYIQKETGTTQFRRLTERIISAVENYRTLQERERQSDLFEEAQKVANVGAWEYDLREEETYISPEVRDIYGVSTDYDASLETDIQRFYHPDDRDRLRKAVRRAIEEGQEYDIEVPITAADGTEKWVRTRSKPALKNGTVRYVRGTVQDITERKERSQELKRMRDLRKQTERIADVGGWEIDTETTEVFWTENLFDLLGVEYENKLSLEESLDSFLEADRSRVADAVGHALETGTDIDVNARFRRPNGEVRWLHVQGSTTVVGEEVVSLRGAIQDITERQDNRQRLEKRGQILRELHSATRDFYPPTNRAEIGDFLSRFISSAFEFSHVSINQFDEAKGCLDSIAQISISDKTHIRDQITPGPNPVWNAYEHGEAHVFDPKEHAAVLGDVGPSLHQGFAVPVGDFGVIVVCAPESASTDDFARELLEVVSAYAESSFERLDTAERSDEIATELSIQQSKVERLTVITETLQQLHRDLTERDTREALDRSVCDHLTRITEVDFAWIGRPEGVDTNLKVTGWAGEKTGYLNKIEIDGGDESLPAQCVVTDQHQCSISDIGSQATDTDWAKHALTAGFASVHSVPLMYDGVLYGVLNVYSTEKETFGKSYSEFVRNAGSLLVNHSRTLERRYDTTGQQCTMIEFELSDPTYPFYALATETDCRIRVDTVIEASDSEMWMLVTVLSGNPETVLDKAPAVDSIAGVDWFGDNDQLSVGVEKPSLASVVGRHGGVLHEAVSDSGGTTFHVKLPDGTPERPVLASLLSEYDEISFVTQQQRTSTRVPDAPVLEERLTDRQREVLQAALHGGYYESPKEATGADIATMLGISDTAVHRHLRAGITRLLESTLRDEVEDQI